MKTSDLIARLVSDISPVGRNVVSKVLTRALITGLASSTALLVALYGIRSDMPELILTSMFWVRLSFPLAIIATAMKLAERLGRPGASLKLAWVAVTLPIATMLIVASGILLLVSPGYRLQLVLGTTWRVTTVNIVVLSIPSLAAIMHAMRQLAPTRLALAGAGSGLLAGAQGLLVYSLYSPEMAVPFWAIWYILAIAVTTSLGAISGPLILRW
jgi:hypothetical protein